MIATADSSRLFHFCHKSKTYRRRRGSEQVLTCSGRSSLSLEVHYAIYGLLPSFRQEVLGLGFALGIGLLFACATLEATHAQGPGIVETDPEANEVGARRSPSIWAGLGFLRSTTQRSRRIRSLRKA